MKVKVKATVVVEIEVEDGWDDGMILFHVEENGCPGTKEVGVEIEEAIHQGKQFGVCWACNLQGENEVLEINGKPPERGS